MPHCGAGLVKGLRLPFTQVQQNLTFLTRHRYFASHLGPDSGMSVAILKMQDPYFRLGPTFYTKMIFFFCSLRKLFHMLAIRHPASASDSYEAVVIDEQDENESN